MGDSKFGPAAFSQGDIMRRMRRLESEVAQLRTARNLQAASIGAGGLRIHSGGGIVVEGADGEGDVFRVNSDPVELFLRPELISALSSQLFAERVSSSTDPETGIRTSSGFGNLDSPADPGPAVTGQVSGAGKAIAFLSAWSQVNLSEPGGFTSQTGIVGLQVTGATSRSPEIINSKYLRFRNSATGVVSDVTDRSTAVVELDDLNEGSHTFTLVYSSADSQLQSEVFFAERNITVIHL